MEPKNFHQLSITYLTWWDRQENPLKVIYHWHRSLWADTFRSDILYWQPDTQDNVLSISQVLTPIGIHWYNECFLQPPEDNHDANAKFTSSRILQTDQYCDRAVISWMTIWIMSIHIVHTQKHTHTHTHTHTTLYIDTPLGAYTTCSTDLPPLIHLCMPSHRLVNRCRHTLV